MPVFRRDAFALAAPARAQRKKNQEFRWTGEAKITNSFEVQAKQSRTRREKSAGS